MMWALLAWTARAAACEPVSAADLGARLDAAEAAFLKMNQAAFETEVAGLRAAVPCLADVITPTQAARLHTIQASAAFLARDEQATVSAFQAANSATPEAALVDWLPAGHPVSIELRYARRFDAPPVTALAQPAGTLWVDGRPADALTKSWPSVLQWSPSGPAPAYSVLHQPGTPLPEWIVEAPTPLSAQTRRRLMLGASAAASAASTAVLLAISADSYQRFSGNIPYDEMDAVRTRANVSGAAGIGTAALTAGLGTALLVTW